MRSETIRIGLILNIALKDVDLVDAKFVREIDGSVAALADLPDAPVEAVRVGEKTEQVGPDVGSATDERGRVGSSARTLFQALKGERMDASKCNLLPADASEARAKGFGLAFPLDQDWQSQAVDEGGGLLISLLSKE